MKTPLLIRAAEIIERGIPPQVIDAGHKISLEDIEMLDIARLLRERHEDASNAAIRRRDLVREAGRIVAEIERIGHAEGLT